MVTRNSSNTYIGATATNEVTRPLQPAFLAIPSGNQSSVTGDGTVYTAVFDSVTINRNSDWDGTSTFTASVTGRYIFGVFMFYTGLTSSHTNGEVRIVTSNRTYTCNQLSSWACRAAGDYMTQGSEKFTDMDSGDTCTFAAAVFNGTKVVNVALSANRDAAYGYLVC